MKIVIDIPDRIYKRKGYLNIIDSDILREALRNGTPLPKGHGDLIDRNELKGVINKFEYYDQVLDAPTVIGADNLIFDAPTIIDKESDKDV